MMEDEGIREGDVVEGIIKRKNEIVEKIIGEWRIGEIYKKILKELGKKEIEKSLGKSGEKIVVKKMENS